MQLFRCLPTRKAGEYLATSAGGKPYWAAYVGCKGDWQWLQKVYRSRAPQFARSQRV